MVIYHVTGKEPFSLRGIEKDTDSMSIQTKPYERINEFRRTGKIL